MILKSYLPKISLKDKIKVISALSSEWGEKRNNSINKLSKSLSRISGKKYCLPVSHGTAAITLAIEGLNLKKGDEIIIPNLTWVACVAPIMQLGLKPVFVNVDSTLCIDPIDLQKNIGKKTKAIFAVDLAGSLPNWHKVISIANNFGLPVIEDAAESIGATYKNQPAGYFGTTSIFSFSPTKLITGGQGGAICTNDNQLFERYKSLYHHGINTKKTGKYFWSDEIGYNFQITNFQATLINSQLSRIDELIRQKRQFYYWYQEFLTGNKFFSVYKFNSSLESNYWLNLIFPNPKFKIKKEIVIFEAKKMGLELRPFFYLLSDMPVYSRYKNKINPYNRFLADFGVCLPYGYDLTKNKIKKISSVIIEVYRKLSR